MKLKSKALTCIGALVVTAGMMWAPSAATASEETASAAAPALDAGTTVLPVFAATQSNEKPQVYTSKMSLVKFDPEVAAAHGYEVRTLENGRQYSVPVGTPSDFKPAPEDTAPGPVKPGEITTYATVWGDCGASYVTLTENQMTTGYSIKYDVLFGKWGVYVHSDQGLFDQDFNLDHGANGGQFDASRGVADEHRGTGFARVNNGSYAMTAAGGACYSGNPQADHHFS